MTMNPARATWKRSHCPPPRCSPGRACGFYTPFGSRARETDFPAVFSKLPRTRTKLRSIATRTSGNPKGSREHSFSSDGRPATFPAGGHLPFSGALRIRVESLRPCRADGSRVGTPLPEWPDTRSGTEARPHRRSRICGATAMAHPQRHGGRRLRFETRHSACRRCRATMGESFRPSPRVHRCPVNAREL